MAYEINLKWTEKNVFIFESPTEALTVSKFINKHYNNSICIASNWHFLTMSDWKDMWIKWLEKFLDKEVDKLKYFNLSYIVDPWHKDVEKNLKKVIDVIRKNKWMIYLSSDPDREWESISYEIKEWFKIKESEYTRIRSTSIEEWDYIQTVQEAIKKNQKIDMNQVNSAITRTILDKLYWYLQTAKLWKISSAKWEMYMQELIKMLENKLNEFVSKNKSLADNDQFKNIIEKYQWLINNLKWKNNIV